MYLWHLWIMRKLLIVFIDQIEVLTKIGVDYRKIWNLYMNQRAAIIGRGVRQRGLLSTILYNIYTEFIITEALDNNSDGIKIGGKLEAAVRYVDDQAMM